MDADKQPQRQNQLKKARQSIQHHRQQDIARQVTDCGFGKVLYKAPLKIITSSTKLTASMWVITSRVR